MPVMTLPLLEGLDGVQKMSKSLGNYIGIAEPASEIFGKLMSISDELMWRYIELLSHAPLSEVQGWRDHVAGGGNPRDIKVRFAREIVTRYHSAMAADQALSEFEARFQRGVIPDDLPEFELAAGDGGLPIANALKAAGLTSSTSDALRMIKQGAVKLDGEKIQDKGLCLAAGTRCVAQVGKRRMARILVK